MKTVPRDVVERLFRKAHADRWEVSLDSFAAALQASVAKAPGSDIEAWLRGLHLEDLALACACAAGHERAWEHFVRELRPVLYRAADAIDATGGARELADSLYGELYGVRGRATERQSLFTYFHGRSSLATWLRAVLAQRHVDAMRVQRRLEPLPDEDEAAATADAQALLPDPDRVRYLALIQRALKAAVSRLDDRDRLRLACYYTQGLTLAESGRVLREHEATVSRQLARTRRTLRSSVEQYLRDEARLDEAQVQCCFAHVLDDPGAMDLGAWLRKESGSNRSI